jgi:hypothetical protein
MMQRQGRLFGRIVQNRSDVGLGPKVLPPSTLGRSTKTPIQLSNADFMADSAKPTRKLMAIWESAASG